jgi:hypothetical protein
MTRKYPPTVSTYTQPEKPKAAELHAVPLAEWVKPAWIEALQANPPPSRKQIRKARRRAKRRRA